ncbi:MAG: GIY-YIG nuclease family protein [Oscillospiraceae bacterium]|nr:GIY-YIG nuclease family protein [Oscillospiraceae bacterium]
MEYYTYILRCSDGSLYTGITTDLARRFSEHAGGTGRAGAKYTAAKKPVAYECAFVCPDRSSASRLEAAIKRLTRAQKLRLISGEDPELAELSLASRFPLPKYE